MKDDLSKKKTGDESAEARIPVGTKGLIHGRPKDLKGRMQHRVPFRWVGFIAFPKESGYHSFLRCFKTVDELEISTVTCQNLPPQYIV